MLNRTISLWIIVTAIFTLFYPLDTFASQNVSEQWQPSRLANGQPDLQGVWASDSATPLERPSELEEKTALTDEEVATLRERAASLFGSDAGDAAFGESVFRAALSDAQEHRSGDGVTQNTPDGTGNYNHFWLIDRWFDNRTSLIVDPPDGRLPPMTIESKERQQLARETPRPAFPSGPEDLGAGLRCDGGRVPLTGRGYNSNYQIVQTDHHVAILMEMMHETRIIPLTSRASAGPTPRSNLGDSYGHWDGDTLVVETTNFKRSSNFSGASNSLRLVERFTRVEPDTLQYEFTMNDPSTWTKPWTARIYMQPAPGTGVIYEFACHEGNYAIANTLRGARLQEQQNVRNSSR